MGMFKNKKEKNIIEPMVRLADDKLANAWDEGFEAGKLACSDFLDWEYYSLESIQNPYRKNRK